MHQSHVIVWDLDDTLGHFGQLNKAGESTTPITVKVRPGIRQALDALSRAGFRHTVLTLASPLYAEIALRGMGLRDCFMRVEGRGQRGKGDAAGLGEALGMKPDELGHRMLFVGDNTYMDAPQDPNVVFHLEPYAVTRPAAELTRLILHLREVGDGSLLHGFERLGLQHMSRKPDPLPERLPRGGLIRCTVAEVGQLLMCAPEDACPIVAFEKPPDADTTLIEISFVPAEMKAQFQQSR